jgi:hypothetical protein
VTGYVVNEIEPRKRGRWTMLGNTLKAFLKMVAENEKLRAEFFELARRHGIEMDAGELTDAELGKVTGGTVNLYLNVAEVRGEARDDKHKDEIDVLSF